MDRTLDDLLDELYAGPPEEFVATRDRLVRETRAAGDRDTARALAGHRRPTAAAAALNRLARMDGAALAAYLDLAPQLRAAYARAATDAGARDERRRLEALRQGALHVLLESAGDRADEVRAILAAALTDDDLATALRAGRLDRVPEPSTAGLEALADAFAASRPSDDAPSRPRRESSDPSPLPAPDARAAARERERELARKRIAEEESRVRDDLTAAKRDAQYAREALRDAEHRVQELERRLQHLATERRRA